MRTVFWNGHFYLQPVLLQATEQDPWFVTALQYAFLYNDPASRPIHLKHI
jgi:hypothetical protein